MDKARLKELRAKARRYFDEVGEQPCSMQELCLRLGVSFEELRGWEEQDDPALAIFSREVRQRVVADLEKGRLSASMATYLHRRYCGEEEARPPLTIRVVVDDGAEK